MRNYVSVPCDLYIHNSEIDHLDNGGEVKGYVAVDEQDNYELVNKYAFQQGLKVDNNTYLVTLIFK
jgi:hypothetical protein